MIARKDKSYNIEIHIVVVSRYNNGRRVQSLQKHLEMVYNKSLSKNCFIQRLKIVGTNLTVQDQIFVWAASESGLL